MNNRMDSHKPNSVRKILFTDLDGTVLDHDFQMHPADVELFQKGHPEVEIIIATGRPMSSIKKVLGYNNLFVNQPLPVAAVTMNGAVYYGPGEKLLGQNPFPIEVQRELIAMLAQFRHLTVMLQTPHASHLMIEQPQWNNYLTRLIADLQPYSDQPELRFMKMLVYSPHPADLLPVRDALLASGLPADGSSSMECLFEISPTGITKLTGIRSLLAARGQSGMPYFAAGDQGNDLEMLSEAALGFAPASGSEKARAAAGQIINTAASGMLGPAVNHILMSCCA